MVYRAYIAATVCISTLVHAASSSTEVQLVDDSSKVSSLASCFTTEKFPALGKQRAYATIAVSKRINKIPPSGIVSYSILNDKDSESSSCDIVMGCVGIVDGPDATATKRVAALITEMATNDTNWIPMLHTDAHQTIARWQRRLTKMYLMSAYIEVTKKSLEHYASIRDTGLSLVWFQHEKGKYHTIELTSKDVLRGTIYSSNLEKDYQFYSSARNSSTREDFAQQVASTPSHHEATVLRLHPERLAAFLAHEFGPDHIRLVNEEKRTIYNSSAAHFSR